MCEAGAGGDLHTTSAAGTMPGIRVAVLTICTAMARQLVECVSFCAGVMRPPRGTEVGVHP